MIMRHIIFICNLLIYLKKISQLFPCKWVVCKFVKAEHILAVTSKNMVVILLYNNNELVVC